MADHRALAINVGANTTLPGVRGPVHADGSFEYVPIPEREPVEGDVPTYEDLAAPVPSTLADRSVHLDPAFPSMPYCEAATYGDEHAVKATPIKRLAAGDRLWFYATLRVMESAAWLPPTWGAFVIGGFELAHAPVDGDTLAELPPAARERAETNVHFAREEPDPRVIALGKPTSPGLLDRAVPLSQPTGGSTPSRVVTDLSNDSGAGPWWRRPLRFAPPEARTLEAYIEGVQAGETP